MEAVKRIEVQQCVTKVHVSASVVIAVGMPARGRHAIAELLSLHISCPCRQKRRPHQRMLPQNSKLSRKATYASASS